MKRRVYLEETDATGILYFTNFAKYATEAFEELLYAHYASLQEFQKQEGVVLPIVHLNADFFAPLRAGDWIEVHLHVDKIGNSSFTLISSVVKEGKVVGRVEIVHAACNSERGGKEEIKGNLRRLLECHLKKGP